MALVLEGTGPKVLNDESCQGACMLMNRMLWEAMGDWAGEGLSVSVQSVGRSRERRWVMP